MLKYAQTRVLSKTLKMKGTCKRLETATDIIRILCVICATVGMQTPVLFANGRREKKIEKRSRENDNGETFSLVVACASTPNLVHFDATSDTAFKNSCRR
jgi:hypothetical protein